MCIIALYYFNDLNIICAQEYVKVTKFVNFDPSSTGEAIWSALHDTGSFADSKGNFWSMKHSCNSANMLHSILDRFAKKSSFMFSV